MGRTHPTPEAAGWRRCTVASRTGASDTGSRATVPWADTATGMGVTLLGGAAAIDNPWLGVIQWWTALDSFGVACDPAKDWSIDLLLIERTPPGLSSDTRLTIGIANMDTYEAGLLSQHGGIRYTAAGRNVFVGHGHYASASVNDDGASAGNVRMAHVPIPRACGVRTAWLTAYGLTAAGVNIAADTAGNGSTAGATFLTSGTPTIYVAGYRSATTAGNEAAVIDAYYRCTAQSAVRL